MALYETTFILRQDIPAHEAHKIGDKFAEMVSTLGGEVKKREYWGLRTLAYIIKKNKKGHYLMLGISAEDNVLKELERNLKINEDVIKYLSIKVDKIDDAPSHMMQAPSELGSLEEQIEE